MIKNTITYKNKIILTLYHQGFPNENLTLKRYRKDLIRKNRIIFTEEYVPDDEWNNLAGYAWEESALLTPKEKYNPYSDKACANMVHRIYPNKPSVIWKKDGTTIAEDDLEAILAFIQKYTGMNLKEQPVFLGDVFLFSPSEFEYHSNEENSIIFYKLKAGMKIIVHFKNHYNILQSKIIDITTDTAELEITTDCNWDNHDVEIYENNSLIYINKDISYIRCINLNLSIAGRKKRIPLTALQEYYEFEQQQAFEKSIIGTPPKQVQESLNELNRILVRKINNLKISDDFVFVQPGELSIAMKKITDIIFRAIDELWLIDSYFTDKGNGLQQMTDWLRLIVNSNATNKNIIFYCNNEDKALNAKQLKNHMKNDPIIRDTLKSKQTDRIQLFQTKSAIHDRFLIIQNNDEYSGLSIGTSFNSLNSNHYCIHVLAHKDAKEVLETLYAWMKTNAITREECKHDN